MTGPRTCPSGHPNPPENRHCGTCGAPLDEPIAFEAAAARPESTESQGTDPIPKSPSSNKTMLLIWGAVALVAVVIGVLVFAQRDSGSDTSSASDADDTEYVDDFTTTTVTIESMCKNELASWVDYVTAPGGSIMDGAAEFGLQSTSYALLQKVWTTYQQELYQVGQDQAQTDALDVLESGCDALGGTYEPGHMAPA